MLRGSFRRFKKSKYFLKLVTRMDEELEKEKEEEMAVDLYVLFVLTLGVFPKGSLATIFECDRLSNIYIIV